MIFFHERKRFFHGKTVLTKYSLWPKMIYKSYCTVYSSTSTTCPTPTVNVTVISVVTVMLTLDSDYRLGSRIGVAVRGVLSVDFLV